MKIMDDKGRLFGKLNIIDLLVILVVVALAFFLGAKVLGGGDNPAAVTNHGPRLEYTVLATEVDPATYEVVKKFVDRQAGLQDQLMASDELLPGYVIDVVATPHITYVACDDGTVKVVESSGADKRLDLLFTCVATAEDAISNEVGTQHIRAGIPHILKTVHFEFQASKVISVTWLEDEG